jgi:hypothetical protein
LAAVLERFHRHLLVEAVDAGLVKLDEQADSP